MRKIINSLSKLYNTKKMSTIMNLLLLCVLTMLYFYRDYWLVPSRIFHISIEIICMAVLIVFYKLHFNKINNDTGAEKTFVALCILLYLCLFLDVVSRIVDGDISSSVLNSIATGSVCMLEILHGELFCTYVFENVDSHGENLSKVKTFTSFANASILLIRFILIIGGAYFYIDASGYCVMRDMSVFSLFFVPGITLFICGVAGGTGIKFSKLITLMSYPLASLVMIAFSYMNAVYSNSLMALSLSIILIYCSLFVNTNRENAILSKTFQTYISDEVLSNRNEITPNANTKTSTLMFCNLQKFSLDMETMEPEDAIIVLNRLFNRMSPIIESNNGKLLEFPGYGLFCIFTGNTHVTDAIRSAGEIMDQLKILNDYNAENHYPRFKMGIGINTGEVILGNVGSQNHMRYSAIGRNVNLASRTSTYAKDGMIALTQNTLDASETEINAVSAGEFIPKGLNKPVHIYSLMR